MRGLSPLPGSAVLRLILAALLTACIGGTEYAPMGPCPSGWVQLESGCIDSARVADDVRGIMRDTGLSDADL